MTKPKEDGTLKHRVIQDKRCSRINEAVHMCERQVLPSLLEHARDLALLSADGGVVQTVVLDFADAFMSVPLAQAELPFNCCSLGAPVDRGRESLYPGEPSSGSFVVFRVLGFGGKPNPLVFARLASFAARSAQALLPTRPFFEPRRGCFGRSSSTLCR